MRARPDDKFPVIARPTGPKGAPATRQSPKDCFASLTPRAFASLTGRALATDGMYAENAGAFFCRNDEVVANVEVVNIEASSYSLLS
jgi:hypothetical protein